MPRPLNFPHKKLVGLDDHLLAALEAWRKDQTPIPTDAAAIRAILSEWLRQHKYLRGETSE